MTTSTSPTRRHSNRHRGVEKRVRRTRRTRTRRLSAPHAPSTPTPPPTSICTGSALTGTNGSVVPSSRSATRAIAWFSSSKSTSMPRRMPKRPFARSHAPAVAVLTALSVVAPAAAAAAAAEAEAGLYAYVARHLVLFGKRARRRPGCSVPPRRARRAHNAGLLARYASHVRPQHARVLEAYGSDDAHLGAKNVGIEPPAQPALEAATSTPCRGSVPWPAP